MTLKLKISWANRMEPSLSVCEKKYEGVLDTNYIPDNHVNTPDKKPSDSREAGPTEDIESEEDVFDTSDQIINEGENSVPPYDNGEPTPMDVDVAGGSGEDHAPSGSKERSATGEGIAGDLSAGAGSSDVNKSDNKIGNSSCKGDERGEQKNGLNRREGDERSGITEKNGKTASDQSGAVNEESSKSTSPTSNDVEASGSEKRNTKHDSDEYEASTNQAATSSAPMKEEKEAVSWNGISRDEILRGCLYPTISLHPHRDHHICVQTPLERDYITGAPKPFPSQRRDKWDDHHVKMPFSEESQFPYQKQGGKKILRKRWPIIRESLDSGRRINSSSDLITAIKSYNRSAWWDFDGLGNYIDDLEKEERDSFFSEILLSMRTICLDSPKIMTAPLPLLKRGKTASITLSQYQVAALLANAFFCTYPRRGSRSTNEYSNYPDINFNRLFQSSENGTKEEKLKCLFNYFRRVRLEVPQGLVTYQRRCIRMRDLPNWRNSSKLLTRIHVDAKGTIEDQGEGMLQVDFANARIGGGVIGNGCVQEEIRFAICPELIAARLFTETLEDNECLVVTGFEQFSKYKGYASSFEFAGNFVDPTPRGESIHRKTSLVAIDAIHYSRREDQYRVEDITRELNKAYVGFYSDSESSKPIPIATGNWGCGAFNGDPHLKSLIQLMAAAQTNRDVAYFTFGDRKLRDGLVNVHRHLVEKKVNIGQLYDLIGRYDPKFDGGSLFEFIDMTLTYSEETDEEDHEEKGNLPEAAAKKKK